MVKVTMRKESVTKETKGIFSLVTLGTCHPHVSPPLLWKKAVSRAPRSLCTSCQHIMVMVATGAWKQEKLRLGYEKDTGISLRTE